MAEDKYPAQAGDDRFVRQHMTESTEQAQGSNDPDDTENKYKASDATGINPDAEEPIDPKMTSMPSQ
jgi:hypothetical protein